MRRLLALSLLLLAACSNSATPLEIDITAGQETDAFASVTSVAISVTSQDTTVNLTQTAMPGGTFDFGDVPGSEFITVTATGYTGTTVVMNGSSLSAIELDAISGGAIPVFVELDNGWSRPPGQLAASHLGGAAAVVDDRFLFLTGGSAPSGATSTDATGVDLYDMFALDGDSTLAAFGLVPETIVSLDPTSTQPDPMLVLLSSQGASVLDYATSEASTPSLPEGLSSFADVAGGRVVLADGGPTGSRFFVVGAARHSSPSSAVLQVNSDGTMAGYTLLTARQGAATTWIENVGLVVAGGSSSSTSSGIEVLGTAAASFVPAPYPPDSVQGAGAITDGTEGVVLIGGRAADGSPGTTRTFDLTCVASSCPITTVAAAMLPVALENTIGYKRSDGTYLVVGDDLTGTGFTLSYVVDLAAGGSTPTPVPFKEPRKGATPIDAPNGTVAILGGEHADGSPALSVELFYP